MLTVDQVPEDVRSRAKSLRELGLSEIAWARDDALRILDMLQKRESPVYGGDVYAERKGQLEHTFDSWHSEPIVGESQRAFARRSCNESRAYIEKYPHEKNATSYFVLVP